MKEVRTANRLPWTEFKTNKEEKVEYYLHIRNLKICSLYRYPIFFYR